MLHVVVPVHLHIAQQCGHHQLNDDEKAPDTTQQTWRISGHSTCSVAPCLTARRQPSTMDAWLSSSEKIADSALPHSAAMVPRFAAKPVGKSRHASVPAWH